MKQVNPFDKTLFLNETKPRISRRTKLEALVIEAELDNLSARPDLIAINEVLDQIKNKANIRLIDISYDSQLTKLPNIEQFTELSHLHLGCRKVKNYGQAHKIHKLDHLFLCNYPGLDLSDFNSDGFSEIRLIGGKVERISKCADFMFLQNCRKLKEISAGHLEILWLDACNNFDHSSLGNIDSLKALQLIGQKNIPDFDFLNNLPDLCDLVVTANNLRGTNLASLKRCNVKTIFLGVANALVKEIGKENRDSIITNGEILMHNGKLHDSPDLYYENERKITN